MFSLITSLFGLLASLSGFSTVKAGKVQPKRLLIRLRPVLQ